MKLKAQSETCFLPLLNASSIIDETSSDSYLDVYNKLMKSKKATKQTLDEIRHKLDSQNESEIYESFEQLKSLYLDAETIELLINLLNHRLWKTRKLAANYLAQSIQAVFPHLVKHLDSKSTHIRFWLYQILPHAGIQSSRHLQKIYKKMDLQERIFILESLAKIADSNSIDFALECLDDPLWSIRNESSKILINLHQKAVKPLKNIIRQGTDNQRYWAFKILGHMSGEAALETFVNIVSSSNYEEKVRSYALTGIQEINNSATIPFLVQTLESDLWPLRAQAAKILISHPHSPHKQILEAMQNGSKTIRYWGFQVLKNIIEDKHLFMLEEAIESPDFDFRFQAISLISQVKGISAAKILSNQLTEDTWYIRKHCADGLVNLGTVSIQVLGKNILKRTTEEIFWICRVFSKLKHSSCIPFLEKLMLHDDKQIRLYALDAVGSIGGSRSAELLIQAFNNQFWVVRSKAHEALIEIGSEAILPLLRQLRNNSESILYWTQKTIEENPLYGARTIMRFLNEANERQFAETLEQLSMLNLHALHELISNDELKPSDILEALKESKNQTPAYHYRLPQDNFEFNLFQKSEYTYEKKQFFKDILTETINSEASQLILKAEQPPIMRIDGVLCRGGKKKLTAEDIQEFFTDSIPDEEIQLFREQGYCKFEIPFDSESQFLAQLSKCGSGLQAHLKPRRLSIPGFESLRLPNDFLTHICKLPRGLVVVSGTKSSGKTSLIHAMLSHINRSYVKNILCVEDSSSLQLQSDKSILSYKSVGRDLKTYDNAVEASLSEDCDIIYLAKIPKYPALETLLELASSQCLVILECNAASTQESLQKILLSLPQEQLKVHEKLMQTALQASINTRLLRNSQDGGYIPALEYFLANSRITENIALDKLDQIETILQKSRQPLTVSMDDYLMELASTKKISYQEAVRWMKDKSKVSVDQIW